MIRTSELELIVGEKQSGFAFELLDLSRVSYRLRDDDNVYLGSIERQMAAAIEEGRRRLEKRGRLKGDVADPKELIGALKKPPLSSEDTSIR